MTLILKHQTQFYMLKKILLSAYFLLMSYTAFLQGIAINEDNSSAALYTYYTFTNCVKL